MPATSVYTHLRKMLLWKSGIPVTLVSQGIIALAGLASGITLARTLGPVGRGEFTAIVLWPNILFLLGELGLGFAFVYFSGKTPDALSELFSLALTASLVLGLLLTVCGWFILPNLLDLSPEANLCLRLALLATPCLLASYHLSYILLGTNHVVWFNAIRIYAALAYAVGIAGAWGFRCSTILGYTLAYLAAQITDAVLAFFLIVWRIRPHWTWRQNLLRPVLAYGLKTYIGSLASQANLRLDQMLMVNMVSREQLGFYTVAVAIAGMLAPIYNAIALVVMPVITRSTIIANGVKSALKFLLFGLLLNGIAAFVIIIFMPWLLTTLFGNSFSPALPIARLTVISAVFLGGAAIMGNSLRSLGLPGHATTADIIGALLNVILLLLLLPRFAAIGAAIAAVGVQFLVVCMQILFILGKNDLCRIRKA